MTAQPVPAGKLAHVLTLMEMTQRPAPAPLRPGPLRLARWTAPGTEKYLTLLRRVGGHWLWHCRAGHEGGALAALLADPAVEVTAVTDPRGIEVGMVELDFRQAGECEIVHLGLIPELTGKGFGRWLIAQARMLAWRKGVERVWLRTGTLDAPSALPLLTAAGFRPFARSVEIFDDPRLTGLYARDAAPHVPVID